ncbi:MAG: DUF6691 family protein [Saprospiraceae bacterium]
MMRLFRFLIIGILFGIVLSKSEVISWYRIQEMFRFQSFHMFGVIGVAVVAGAVIQGWIKYSQMKGLNGINLNMEDKPKTYWASILGGTLFGLGWALTGACPGPLYILLGHGYVTVLVIIVSALGGTLAYGLLRNRLPH